MKKFLALILVVCLALGCFAGCKKDKNTKSTMKPTATTSAPATSAPAGDEIAGDETTSDEETEAPADEETEAPADETEKPSEDDNASVEPAGDWEMPDNSELDCLAIDFRNGTLVFDPDTGYYDEGYFHLAAGRNDMGRIEVTGVDPDGANPGYANFAITGSDPNLYMYDLGGAANGAGSYEYDMSEYAYLKIVVKNNTADTMFQLFFFEQFGQVTGNDVVTFSGISSNDTEFKTYYIDLRASGASNTLTVSPANNTVLGKTFSAMRFDLPDAEGSFDVQYMGFFTSLEDAQAYK